MVTASLDKTIAAWRLAPNQDADPMRPYYCEVQKIAAPGGPIFSIAPARPLFHQCTERKSASPGASPSSSSSPAINTIFCGTAAKEVVSWQPLVPTFDPVSSLFLPRSLRSR